MNKLYDIFNEIKEEAELSFFKQIDYEIYEKFVYEMQRNISKPHEVRLVLRMIEELRLNILQEYMKEKEKKIKKMVEHKNMDTKYNVQTLGTIYMFDYYFRLKTEELEELEERLERQEEDTI